MTNFLIFLSFLSCISSIQSLSSSNNQVNVQCETTKGDIIITVYPEWAPLGAKRFIDLVNDEFFTDIALYRSVPKFLTQFGITDNPEKKHWQREEIPDDPLNKPILKYYISYAGGGPNTRSTQLFIAYEDLEFLGKSPWEVPFGEVTSGKDVVDSWYKGYGDMPPWGKGPDQGKLHNRGNAYIRAEFPLIDFIISCAVIDDAKSETQSEPIDLKSKELPIETIQDPRSFLRQDLENQAQPSEPSSISNYPAFRAIMLLAVAISVLLCLYQYNSSPVSAKSQDVSQLKRWHSAMSSFYASIPTRMVGSMARIVLRSYFSSLLRRHQQPFSSTSFLSSRSHSTSSWDKLSQLRLFLSQYQYSAFILPITDPHLSEYIPPSYERVSYLSSFTGSSGTLIITLTDAFLWTDGRYHLQAELELNKKYWKLMKDGEKNVLNPFDYLQQNLDRGSRVGYDSTLHSAQSIQILSKILLQRNILLTPFDIGYNPIDMIWGDDRPPIPTSQHNLRIHPLEYAGSTPLEKLNNLRIQYFTSLKNDHEKSSKIVMISASLDEIAWVYNIRGNDIKYNPTLLAYTIILNNSSLLYLNLDASLLSDQLQQHFQSQNVHIRPYDQFFSDLQMMLKDSSMKVLIDPGTTNDAIWRTIPEDQRIPLSHSPIEKMKAIKNGAELNGMKACHLRDGTAYCHLLWELFNKVLPEVNEIHLDEKLSSYRKLYSPHSYLYSSFETIAGVGPNGAIVHYRAKPNSCRILTQDEILLLDSGGQYLDGTTDVTRTIHLGTPTPYQKEMYTRVLMGHIDLASTIFPSNTPGCLLDSIARRHLWKVQKNYLHGTGHGVGAALNVHEGPQRISSLLTGRNYTQPLLEGMIVSIEPGYYETNSFGIRLENLYYIRRYVPSSDNSPHHLYSSTNSAHEPHFLQFESLTYIPFQKNFIDLDLLSSHHIEWLNTYHQLVYEKLQHQLFNSQVSESSQVRQWLEEICSPIQRK